jgi:CBS domain-containing protein
VDADKGKINQFGSMFVILKIKALSDMDVKSILELKGDFVLTIPPEATLNEASEMLGDNSIGAIVVADESGTMAGILSERDIAISLVKYGADLGEMTVSEVMTGDVIFCSTETTVKQVLDLMLANGIRHLPVIEQDKLKGVISLRDVVGNWLGAISGDIGDENAATEPPLDPFQSSAA